MGAAWRHVADNDNDCRDSLAKAAESAPRGSSRQRPDGRHRLIGNRLPAGQRNRLLTGRRRQPAHPAAADTQSRLSGTNGGNRGQRRKLRRHRNHRHRAGDEILQPLHDLRPRKLPQPLPPKTRHHPGHQGRALRFAAAHLRQLPHQFPALDALDDAPHGRRQRGGDRLRHRSSHRCRRRHRPPSPPSRLRQSLGKCALPLGRHLRPPAARDRLQSGLHTPPLFRPQRLLTHTQPPIWRR